jgi:hypothetical protein
LGGTARNITPSYFLELSSFGKIEETIKNIFLVDFFEYIN